MKAVTSYFKVASWHLLGETKENHKTQSLDGHEPKQDFN
jgi:hypothetical protein